MGAPSLGCPCSASLLCAASVSMVWLIAGLSNLGWSLLFLNSARYLKFRRHWKWMWLQVLSMSTAMCCSQTAQNSAYQRVGRFPTLVHPSFLLTIASYPNQWHGPLKLVLSSSLAPPLQQRRNLFPPSTLPRHLPLHHITTQ